MPGLIRGVARVAVVAGTATAVSNRVSRRQARRWGAQGPDPDGQPEPEPTDEAPPAPEAVAAAAPDPIERLKQLGELHEQGILTNEEFRVGEGQGAGGLSARQDTASDTDGRTRAWRARRADLEPGCQRANRECGYG